MRKRYLFRFFGRLAVLALVLALYLTGSGCFRMLRGGGFFRRLTVLHALWLVWMGNMLLQLFPSRGLVALGSQKQFACHYRPAGTADGASLRRYVRRSSAGAAKVLVLWTLLLAGIGLAVRAGLLGPAELTLTVAVFYVCDLVCVLFWCPFRVLLLKNRCCTTCRIFNWDHLMMFAPFAFVPGFFTWSLLAMAAAVFLRWEFAFFRHPERFWEGSNPALRCARCRDRLCGRPEGE